MSFLRRIGNHFLKREVPLWATFVLAIGGAWATNVILPDVNKQNEYDRMKSAFVLQSLDSLNEETSILVAAITALNESALNGADFELENKIEMSRVISSLQWEAMEISMFLDEDSTELITNYQRSLNSLKHCLGLTENEFNKECSDQAILEFLQSAQILGSELTKF